MSAASANHKTPIYKVLYFQVICAIVIGILLGFLAPEIGAQMKPFGDGFIRLIKMIIAPVIFCTVVTGIAGMEDMKKVGKTGGLALLYFEVVSTIALIIGLIIVNTVQPGVGMHVDPNTLDQAAVSAYTGPGKMQTTTEFLMNVIPNTVVGAFANGDILQVLFFSILFGFALHKFGGRGTLIFDVIEKSAHVLFQIVGMIMRVAPVGAFGAMAFTIGKYGIASLLPLAKLMGTFYLTCRPLHRALGPLLDSCPHACGRAAHGCDDHAHARKDDAARPDAARLHGGRRAEDRALPPASTISREKT